MTKWINYHHLYYFMMIAEYESVSKAAEVLRIGQPTLSAQLKVFEDSMGVKLFERKHQRLFLSEQGKIAFEYAKNIFKLGDEMFEALNDRLKIARPHLRIGSLDSVAKHVMLKLTQAAYKFQNCQVSVIEGSYEALLQEVKGHQLDLAIANFEPRLDVVHDLYVRVLTKKPISVYAAPRFKLLRKKFPQSLQDQPFVLPTHSSNLRYSLDAWFEKEKIKIDIVAETQDSALKNQLAIAGVALMTAPEYGVHDSCQSGELIEIGKLQGVSEKLFLISAKRKIENPIAMHLMKNFKI